MHEISSRLQHLEEEGLPFRTFPIHPLIATVTDNSWT